MSGERSPLVYGLSCGASGGDKEGRESNRLQPVTTAAVVAALALACFEAIEARGAFSVLGAIYYIICVIAFFKNRRYAAVLLWVAAAVHAVLIGYMVFEHAVRGMQVCLNCMMAAGFVLVAAVAIWKPVASVFPAVLLAALWYAWPWLFPVEYRFEYMRTNSYVVEQPSGSEGEVAVERVEPARTDEPARTEKARLSGSG